MFSLQLRPPGAGWRKALSACSAQRHAALVMDHRTDARAFAVRTHPACSDPAARAANVVLCCTHADPWHFSIQHVGRLHRGFSASGAAAAQPLAATAVEGDLEGVLRGIDAAVSAENAGPKDVADAALSLALLQARGDRRCAARRGAGRALRRWVGPWGGGRRRFLGRGRILLGARCGLRRCGWERAASFVKQGSLAKVAAAARGLGERHVVRPTSYHRGGQPLQCGFATTCIQWLW
jgi:hypothetical protein